MANNKQRSGGKNTGLKVFASIVSILLAASVITTGVCFGTNRWQVTPDEPAQEENYDGSIIEETTSDGVSLMSTKIATADYAEYGISPLAETAYTLTATVFDEDGSSSGIPQNVTYTAEWKNPSSEWANGKDVNDYYQVTSTGINTATATCLQAFGEPVTITATSYFNPEAYCTWEANYVKRVTNVTAEVSTDINITQNNEYYIKNLNVTYGVGTLEGKLYIQNYNWDISSTFANYINPENNSYMQYFYDQADSVNVDFDVTTTYYNSANVELVEGDEDFHIYQREMFLSNMSESDVDTVEELTNNYQYFDYAFAYAGSKGTDDITLSVRYDYKYDGVSYGTGHFETPAVEVVGTYPQPSSVTGNDVTLVH